MCYERNIHIYQQGQPTWRVVNFQPADTRPCLHLSFHDGEHYNSVRCQSDSGGGPAEPIHLVDSSSDGAADEGVRAKDSSLGRLLAHTRCQPHSNLFAMLCRGYLVRKMCGRFQKTQAVSTWTTSRMPSHRVGMLTMRLR